MFFVLNGNILDTSWPYLYIAWTEKTTCHVFILYLILK